MKIIVVAAGAFALAASPAAGQSQPGPADPAGAAEYLLHHVCMPLLDGQEATPARVAQLAASARLVERDGLWLARLGQSSGLVLSWDPANRSCQVSAAGTGPVADRFLALLERGGWTSHQRAQPALEGGTMDLLCGRPEDWEHDVCIGVLQQAPVEPTGVAMTFTVIHAP